MLLFVLLAVFIGGLMVGRTPEYLGKKIEAREVKLTLVGTLYTALAVLVLTALAVATKYGAPSIYNSGPQGFAETLYAYTSQGNNNGSAFAGYTGFVQPNAPGNAGAFGITFADLMGGLAMLGAALHPAARRSRRGRLARDEARFARRPRHLPHRHAHVRGPPDLRDRDRRGAHLLPRPPARPARAGPDRPALLIMRRDLINSLLAIVVLTAVLGLAYPLLTTGVAQVLFPGKADGSQVERDGQTVGSQPDRAGLRRARPSSSIPRPSQTEYNGAGTAFNNLGPNSQELSDALKKNRAAYDARRSSSSPARRSRSTP